MHLADGIRIESLPFSYAGADRVWHFKFKHIDVTLVGTMRERFNIAIG